MPLRTRYEGRHIVSNDGEKDMWHPKTSVSCQPSFSPPRQKVLSIAYPSLLHRKRELMENSRVFLRVTEFVYTPTAVSPQETVRRHSCSQNTKGAVLLKVLAGVKEVELKIKTNYPEAVLVFQPL